MAPEGDKGLNERRGCNCEEGLPRAPSSYLINQNRRTTHLASLCLARRAVPSERNAPVYAEPMPARRDSYSRFQNKFVSRLCVFSLASDMCEKFDFDAVYPTFPFFFHRFLWSTVRPTICANTAPPQFTRMFVEAWAVASAKLVAARPPIARGAVRKRA